MVGLVIEELRQRVQELPLAWTYQLEVIPDSEAGGIGCGARNTRRR